MAAPVALWAAGVTEAQQQVNLTVRRSLPKVVWYDDGYEYLPDTEDVAC